MDTQMKKIVNYKAELIADSVNYSGIIENISSDSLYMRAVPLKPLLDFSPGSKVEIIFRPVEGEAICLFCKVKWSYRTPPHGLTNSLGMEILYRHPVYDELVSDLYKH